MSLTFAATTTDAVNCGSNAVLDSLAEITILTWMYPTSFGSDQFIMTKRDAGNAGWGHRINDASGNLYVNKPKVAGGVSAVTNDAPLTLNAWNFVAATGSNNVSSNNCSIYTGDLTTLAVERSYGTRGSLASGTPFNDSALNLLIGNRPSVSQSFVGRLGVQAIFNRVLTLAEIQSWQFDPRMMDGCVGLWNLGDNGTGTQPDYSGNGNAGTVTGATQSDNPPLRRRWGRRVLVATPSAVTGYTLSAGSGTFTTTGTDATLRVARKLSAASGTFTTTGTDATLRVGRKITAASGTFTATGTDATLRVGRVLTAASGTFTTTGTAAALRADRRLTAGSGTYTITGTDATLTYSGAGGVTLIAESGTFTTTGTDAILRVGRKLVVASGSFTVTGTDAALRAARRLTASSGSYAVTGSDAALRCGRVIGAASGTFTTTGTDAALRCDRRLVAGAGVFVLVGTDATLTYSAAIIVGTAFRITDRSGPRYVLDSLSGARYPITHRSGPRYHITERDT